MPYSWNGIGTDYTKHKNENAWAENCPRCGKMERLASFDTHLAFTVLFVPIVKLKALRVVAFCPSCTQHVAVPHAEWRAKLDQLIVTAKTALGRDDTGVDAVLPLLQQLSGLGDKLAFETLLPLFEAKLGDDARGLHMLGSVASAFDAPDVAVRLLEKSIALDVEQRAAGTGHPVMPERDITMSDASWRELARVHMLRVEPRDALRCHDRASVPPDVWLLLLIVEAFQLRGLHQDALKLLERIDASLPQKERKAATGELRHRSQTELKRAKPGWIWTPTLGRIRYPSAKLELDKPKTTRRDLKMAAAIAGVFFGVYALAQIPIAALRPVWVVNGTSESYDVEVDGHIIKAKPYRPVRIDAVGEGEHTMTVRAAHLGAPRTEQFTMGPTTFMLRALSNDVFVLNPDRSALLLHESTRYGRREPTPDEAFSHAFAGPLLHHVDAHFVFAPFPKSVEDKWYTSNVRRRLSTPLTPDAALELAREIDPKLEEEIVRARRAFDANDVGAQGAPEAIGETRRADPTTR